MSLAEDATKYLAGKHILLIDDSEPFQKLTTAMLKKMGVESISVASTLAEGMNQLHLNSTSSSPDIELILMDLNLPDGSGMLGCEFISKHVLTSQIPIVVVSGNDHLNTISLVLQSGASDYLHKPLQGDLLGLRLGLLLKLQEMNEFYSDSSKNN